MKKYNHSRSYGSRITNWRTLVMSISILACLVLANYGNQDKVYVAEAPKEEAFMVPVVVTPPPTIEDKIREYFPKSWPTMIAIAHAESHMKMTAQGFNCFYNKYETVVYQTRVKGAHSAACKPGHRKYAYSTDCFVLQRNYKGQKCPQGVTIDEHLEEVAELSKRQGLEAWSAFNNGSYKKHLTSK